MSHTKQNHDPYDIYRWSCGLRLFETENTADPAAWARHRAHMAAFQAETQARIDAALAAHAALTEDQGPCAEPQGLLTPNLVVARPCPPLQSSNPASTFSIHHQGRIRPRRTHRRINGLSRR